MTRVLIDARVVGEDGEPVLGLAADDFRVRIDDRPVQVESAQWVGGTKSPTPPPSADRGGQPEIGPRGRLIVFVVQKSQSSDRLVGLLRTLGEAGRLLAQLTPDDRVAVLSFDSHLKVWLDFTSDVDRARTVLAEEVMLTTPGPVEPSTGVSLVARLSQELGRRTYAIEDALHLLGIALEPLPGSKSVVLVGYGFGELTVTLGFVGSRLTRRPRTRFTQLGRRSFVSISQMPSITPSSMACRRRRKTPAGSTFARIRFPKAPSGGWPTRWQGTTCSSSRHPMIAGRVPTRSRSSSPARREMYSHAARTPTDDDGTTVRDACQASMRGVKVTSPAAVSPGPSTMIPVSVRPSAARLNPSMQLVAGSTQKKSRPVGV